ncbi:MAG: CotH kinase family protein [Oscillospiraceae bacterium]|nr:CotH kinase family protein [Oscillospiraceae bacterium]
MTFLSGSDREFALDDTMLTDGMSCACFESKIPYAFSADRKQIGTLRFYRSANVPVLYLDTATGSMEYIHKDKSHEEAAYVTLIGADGTALNVEHSCFLKGRGNSTWELDKKSYLLSISPEIDLLGMGQAANWVLLANAEDATNLRNTVALGLAKQAGMQWVPQSAYVDVYLNGSYSGLYLLTEKVEIHRSRLNLNEAEGDFLCKIEYGSRQESLRNPFITQNGRTVEITNPKFPDKMERNRIESQVNWMEQMILSGDDLNACEEFDLDSWVHRYLIDEIMDNVDSDGASSYFYYAEEKFHAGPVWDYDLTLGAFSNRYNPVSMIVGHMNTEGQPSTPYYEALYRNPAFYDRMVLFYQTTYLPALEEMLNEGIEKRAEEISCAAEMNRIRWRCMFETMTSWNSTVGQTPEDLAAYLDARVRFLSSIWIDNTEYCSVNFRFSEGGKYWNTYVEKGQPLTTDYRDLGKSVWIREDTGEVFDLSQPMESDLRLDCQVSAPGEDHSTRSFIGELSTRDILTLMSISVLAFLLFAFLNADIRHRKEERRASDD